MAEIHEEEYDEKGAKALDRKAQIAILKARNVTFRWNAKETDLVKLIIESNPKTDAEVADVKAQAGVIDEPAKEEVVAEEPEVRIVEKREGDFILKTDLTKHYRADMVLPKEKYDEMKARGINVDILVK